MVGSLGGPKMDLHISAAYRGIIIPPMPKPETKLIVAIHNENNPVRRKPKRPVVGIEVA